VFINIEPLIGAALGISLFGDPVGWPVLLGGMLIVLGSIVVVRGERPNASHAADATHGLSMD
jgi:drug/metabolite transporter (DMT)-like permease